MTDDRNRFNLILDIFDEVCDLPIEERHTHLASRCQGDLSLRQEVESLLRADGSDHYVVAAAESGKAFDMLSIDPSIIEHTSGHQPTRIAGYRIIREIGRGGMGIIYEAEQESPNRRVAIKVLQNGSLDRMMLRRFQQEAQLLGKLQHVGIAQIFEAGIAKTSAGTTPFIAMEYIEGRPIDVYARSEHLSISKRLELVARVCDAVQHAHQNQVIHRDLKPGNVIVIAQPAGTLGHTKSTTLFDDVGQPKILDFGIARHSEDGVNNATLQTEAGQLIGTLAYMSPEQLEGDSRSLDTRCDVYALGVMLYELVVDRRPHDLQGLSFTDAARKLVEAEPPTLGTIRPELRGDIETIAAKALEKDRSRRYSSAAEMAADIRRHLADEPIQARPATTLYVISRFARRNKGLVAGIVAAFLVLIASLFLVESQRQIALTANERLQVVVEYQKDMLRKVDVQQMGQQIAVQLREEARRIGDARPQIADRVTAFESVLSEINATSLASRSLDQSLLGPAISALEEGFSDQPRLRAELRSSLSEVYNNIGLRNKAIEQERVTLATRIRELGSEHPDTLASRFTICQILLEIDLFEEALGEITDLAEIQRRVLGNQHLATLRSLRTKGELLSRLAKEQLADEVLNEALAQMEEVLGPYHIETQDSRLSLGEHYLQNRFLDKALAEFESVLTLRQNSFGPDDPMTLDVLVRVARVLFMQRKHGQAAILMERYSESLGRLLGDEHPRYLSSRYQLANALTESGNYQEAQGVIDDALLRQRTILGSDHPETALTVSAGLRLYVRTGHWQLAEQFGREALAIAQRTLGPDDLRTLVAKSDLSAVFLKSGRHDAAKKWGQSTFGDFSRVLGPDHLRTLGSGQTLAKILVSAGEYEDAASLLNELLDKTRRLHPDSPLLAGCLGIAVSNEIQLRQAENAVELAKELLRWCTEHNAGNATRSRCYLWIARAQYAKREFDECEKSLSQASEYARGTAAEQAWPTTLVNFYKQLIRHRRDVDLNPSEVLELYRIFLEQSPSMRPEDRNAIKSEIKSSLSELGVETET